MKKHERFSFLFTGAAYAAAGILILLRPKFLYYWIAGIFFIQGIVSIVRAFTDSEDKKAKAGEKA